VLALSLYLLSQPKAEAMGHKGTAGHLTTTDVPGMGQGGMGLNVDRIVMIATIVMTVSINESMTATVMDRSVGIGATGFR
jgi:hypothetical protein